MTRGTVLAPPTRVCVAGVVLRVSRSGMCCRLSDCRDVHEASVIHLGSPAASFVRELAAGCES